MDNNVIANSFFMFIPFEKLKNNNQP